MKHIFKLSELPKLAVPSDLFNVRFIHADSVTVAFNELKIVAEVPSHQHIHETIDFVQEGMLQMTIGDETVEMNAGSVARVPSNVWHGAKALSDCKVINFFYPVRDDFSAATSSPTT
ncbi:MAG: cupin domain-containing protein [Phycisphaerae bacterium]|nr:cupin domain-containing protein [Saprospiraceae bacterium]